MFAIKKNESSNKTIRMSNDLIKKLETLAEKNGVSFNKVVVQCCEFAIDNLKDETENRY